MTATSLSRKILIGSMVVFILYFFRILEQFFGWFVLTPVSIYPGFELWRLLTYPLAPGFFGLIITAICFSFPGEELESMVGTRQFGMLLLIVILATALMHTALFFGSTIILGGPTNASLFVLVGFYYLFPHSEIRVFFFNIRSWVILASTIALVVIQTILAWTGGSTPLLFFSYGGFGLLLGALYFHARYQKYAFMLRPIRSVERMVEKVATGSSGAQKQKPVRSMGGGPTMGSQRVRSAFQKSGELSDEERLNSILDRINEKGYDDLNEDDQRFLREYSRKL